jgi:predicted transcriptional regulator
MATLAIRLSDEKHERLRQMAMQRKISINKLMEEMSTATLAQFDAEVRFRARAQQGSVKEGLKILDMLDAAFTN